MNNQIEPERAFPLAVPEQIHEAICLIDKEGCIFYFNDGCCCCAGYKAKELFGVDIFPELLGNDKKEWEALWEKTRSEKKWVTHAIWKHGTGNITESEVIYAFIDIFNNEFICVFIRPLQAESTEEALLKTISEHTSGLVGKDFFHELAKHVAACLHVRYSLITECSNYEKTRIRTISYIDNGKIRENVEYDSVGTPCEIIMKGNDFFQKDEVEKIFPKKKGIKAYIGVPIYKSSTGEVIGHMAAYDDKPMMKKGNLLSVLKIFASRAGAELERMEIHRRLENANIELKERLNEIELLKNRLQAENHYLQDEIKLSHNFEEIISKSIKFKKVLCQVEQVANTDATVLILGESGTGKELIARALHNISNRSKRPLVKVNLCCLTFPFNRK